MKKYKKAIIIGLILWNLFLTISLFFSYSPHFDTFESITKDYLLYNVAFVVSTGGWYLLDKLAIKIEDKYKDQ